MRGRGVVHCQRKNDKEGAAVMKWTDQLGILVEEVGKLWSYVKWDTSTGEDVGGHRLVAGIQEKRATC